MHDSIYMYINKGEKKMAKSSSDYFGLSYIVSVILAIIPITAWICGVVTRFMEGKIVAGIIRIFLGGWILWILDLIWMIVNKKIIRLLNI